jgi:hypothetical protein
MGLHRATAVQSFVREGPCLLGISARSQAGRECFVRCNWRREKNWKLTFSEILACFQLNTKPYSREDFSINGCERERLRHDHRTRPANLPGRMPSMTFTLTPEQLYELVWSEPMLRLAGPAYDRIPPSYIRQKAP